MGADLLAAIHRRLDHRGGILMVWDIAGGILLAALIVILWPLIWRLAVVAFFAFIAYGAYLVSLS